MVEPVEYGEEADSLLIHFIEYEMKKIAEPFVLQFQVLGEVRLYRLEGLLDSFRETQAELDVGSGSVVPEVPVEGGDVMIACVLEVGSNVTEEDRFPEQRRAYDAHVIWRWLGQMET